MPGIKVEDEDDFELALKRFRKQTERAGVISECRRREAYEKPSIRAKRKAAAAQKRLRKRLRRMRIRDARDY
ncbi:MAG: 30S ribosomal protein S21 [Zetaproteobacteria bacterium]|nr:MAG: 30S ribosomal protein S21 [Zetaproteobacteria bacterium]